MLAADFFQHGKNCWYFLNVTFTAGFVASILQPGVSWLGWKFPFVPNPAFAWPGRGMFLQFSQGFQCHCLTLWDRVSVQIFHCYSTCTSKQSVRCSVKINYCKCWFQKAVTFDIGVCVLWRDNAVKILSQGFNSPCTVVQKDNLLLTSFMYVILLLLIINFYQFTSHLRSVKDQ